MLFLLHEYLADAVGVLLKLPKVDVFATNMVFLVGRLQLTLIVSPVSQEESREVHKI